MLDTTEQTSLVLPGPALRLDKAALHRYLCEAVPGFPQHAALQVFQFSHGQSNPTYLVKAGGATYVLRKKPPGRVLPSAHAVEREYRVLAALQGTPVPVPRVVALCEEPAVIGTAFYVMEHVKGVVFDDPAMPGESPATRAAAYDAMAAALAALHSVDPGAVGLAGYGKAEGYSRRQVWRWSRQYASAVQSGGGVPLPEMLALGRWLEGRAPAADSRPGPARISHGDYRLDNLVFDRGSAGGGGHGQQAPRVLAILDWELSTLGDPLADLAYNCMPYHLPPEVGSMALPRPLPPGVPTEAQYVAAYCRHAGRAHPLAADWPFYLALSLFRLASILAGVGARAAAGNASSRAAAQVGAGSVVKALALAGLRVASSGDSHAALAGTPQEPYANPRHPSAHLDTNVILEGNIQEPYANPSPAWVGSAGRAGQAAEEYAAASGAAAQRPAGCGCGDPACRCGTPGAAGCTCKCHARRSQGHQPFATAAQPSQRGSGGSARGCPGGSAGSSGGGAAVGLGPSPRVQPVLAQLHAFMEAHVYPAEATLSEHACSNQRWTISPAQEALKRAAQAQGLWNLWIPADMAEKLRPLVSALPAAEQRLLLGPGLSNIEYAHCAEVMGRSVWAPEAFNCSAPDTGNMEVLARYGSPGQQRAWLLRLLRGEARSCFAMTEPAVASSDATNIEASIVSVGDGYVLNGRKWWISGACDPRCAVAIFMGKSSPGAAAAHRQQSMVLVPMDSPGVDVVRPLPVFGFDDAPHGHAEMTFTDVRVPGDAMILGEGRGFEIAQGRLGPGRLHHCMRLVGMGERAIALMKQRAAERVAFGRPLAGHQAVRLDIARSRLELDAARLVVLEASRALDAVGNKAARGQIAQAKALTPSAVLAVLERAIQVHGGAGVSDGTPLAAMWAAARTLRLADGPDIVHLETIAKLELTLGGRARL